MKKVLNLACAAFILGAPLAVAGVSSAQAQGAPQSVALLRVDPVLLNSGFRASKVTGSTVINEKNETVGKVDDVIITKDGSHQFAVLSVGGFLGVGDHLVAVPYETLRFTADNKIMLNGATKDELKAMPEFKYATK